jgi:hypothetical protein
MLGRGDQLRPEILWFVAVRRFWFCRFSFFMVGVVWFLSDGDDGQDRRGDLFRGRGYTAVIGPPHIRGYEDMSHILVQVQALVYLPVHGCGWTGTFQTR